MPLVPARRNQQVLPQMPGKILQDRMLLALGIYRGWRSHLEDVHAVEPEMA
jgi:hypothetical protein